MKYVMGIDPGYDRIGIAIIEKIKRPKVIFSECFSPQKNKTYQEKIHTIGDHIIDVINQYNPEEMSIEKIFFRNNQKTAMDVSGVRGVAIYCGMKEDVDVFEYPPAQIKMTMAGFGKANKEQIKKMVFLLTDIEKEKERIDDELDAIAIAYTHTIIHKNSTI